jgi:hypothetical protein
MLEEAPIPRVVHKAYDLDQASLQNPEMVAGDQLFYYRCCWMHNIGLSLEIRKTHYE